MGPVEVLQSFTNEILQAKTTEQLQVAVNMAMPEVGREAYGQSWAYQVADLAAHDLVSEASRSGAEYGGREVSEETMSKRKLKFTESTADPMSDDALSRTLYGARFVRRRKQVAVGGWSTGSRY